MNTILEYIVSKHNKAVALTLQKIEELYLEASDDLNELTGATREEKEVAQALLLVSYTDRKFDWVEREEKAFEKELGALPCRFSPHEHFMKLAGLEV